MRISRKAQHAVRAALDLSLNRASVRGHRSAEVALRTGVPEKFLEAILRDLREAGLIESKRGPDGGHRLAADPRRVTVGQLVAAIDGSWSSLRPAAGRRDDPAEACVRSLWRRVEAAVEEVLGSVTLEDLTREADAPDPLDFTI
jgi:Rrf2 family protein